LGPNNVMENILFNEILATINWHLELVNLLIGEVLMCFNFDME
jgi:hypothetical protein